MLQNKKNADLPEIPQAKKKARGSAGEEIQGGAGKRTAAKSTFPIVGIGASAGGLEALEILLANVRAESGMAFVIVQHLDPTYKGMLVELLQRVTPMPVFQIKDRMRVEPNSVYVIPPNKDLSIVHGVFNLLVPFAPRGLRLPIDFFLRSLAEDQQEHSLGMILSGMGSDGTAGLRAIKEKGGSVFVQSPETAKFDGMPRSAIEAGLADVIAPVNELPASLSAFLHHAPLFTQTNSLEEAQSKNSIEKVLLLLRDQTGHDFSLYKKTTIYRRIERRIGLHHMENIAAYLAYLRENPGELELLFNELLIGVTSFFRDPAAWETLKTVALPALLAERAPEQTLRAWVTGCSTGEEAYTLAMVFKEALDSIKPQKFGKIFTLQIFATDLDAKTVEKAREGVYAGNIATDVSPERLERFFVQTERGYRVTKEIREMVIFAQQNLIMDPPFTKLDLLSCRNLLIYLTPELQKKLLPLFHYSLNPGGILFLGNSETVGGFNDLFPAVDAKMRLYRRREVVLAERTIDFPILFTAGRADKAEKAQKPAVNLQVLADNLILQTYAPAAVLTNETGDILYINGRTGKYLEPAAGKANWNIFVMAREGLRYELKGAFDKVLQQKETVTLKNLVVGTNGGAQTIEVTIQPLHEKNSLGGMVLIVFRDVDVISRTSSKPRRGLTKSTRLDELEREVNQARQEVQSIREEMQTSQEELKSSNEELQSTNEELQSTNEELTTSKEEMQSMNEELQTVNNELQAKVSELSFTNSDMKNLLDSSNIATLFLDKQLRVRRITNQTSQITRLIPSDVGRPITDIASALLYPQLAEDAREVLQTLVKLDRQISTPDGSWFTARILPYRTLENMIDGVVITFSDITEVKKLEGKDKLAAELLIANQELAFQMEEKEKRAAELVVINANLEKLTAELKK